MSRTLRLRSPEALAVAIGVLATLVIALVFVVVLLLAGGGKAVSDNATLIAALFALGGVFTTQLVNITLEAQRAQDSALQAFLDQMSHSDTAADTHSDAYSQLRTAAASGHKRAVLRAKLQTLLLQLNEERKGVLLSFLHGTKLSRKEEITPYEYTKEGSKVKGEERWNYPILRLNDIDFSRTKRTPDTKLTFDDLRGIILHEAKLSKVNLSGANLENADLSNADLSGALLRKASPQDSERIPGESHNEYYKAVPKRVELPPGLLDRLLETNLSGANLSGADLSGADLSGADLSGRTKPLADLGEAAKALGVTVDAVKSGIDQGTLPTEHEGERVFVVLPPGADLSGAKLDGANLSGANLSGAKGVTNEQLRAARSLEGATMPDGQTLRGGETPHGPTFEEWLKRKRSGEDEKNE